MSITINGGATMPGWFDLYDWPIGVGSKDDEKNKLLGVQQIEACIKKLEEVRTVHPGRIVSFVFTQCGPSSRLNLAEGHSEESHRRRRIFARWGYRASVCLLQDR